MVIKLENAEYAKVSDTNLNTELTMNLELNAKLLAGVFMKKPDQIIINQIAIMEALVVLMCHLKADVLGPMHLTWQFDNLKRTIKDNQDAA